MTATQRTPILRTPARTAQRSAALAVAERGARRRVDAFWNCTALIVIWGTSLVVVVLWVAGGGLQALFAFDSDSLTTLGRLTGLVSANLLLYQVLRMARVPVF